MTQQELDNLKPRIERLNELRAQIAATEGREALSDADFARRFLPFSSTTWSKLQSGTYGGGFDTIARRLDDAIADVEGRLPNIEDAAAKRKAFRRTTLARSVLTALASAREGDTLGFQQRRDGDALDIRGSLPDGRTSVLARLISG